MKQKKVLKLESFKNESLSKEQTFFFQGGTIKPPTHIMFRTYDWDAMIIDHETQLD